VTSFIGPAPEVLDSKIIELIETEIKYEGYIKKATDQVAKCIVWKPNAFLKI
jgi:tRNA uridine 5-carboxymethylaminomethyl modification enzyme